MRTIVATVVIGAGAALAAHWVGVWMLFVFAIATASTNVLDRPSRHSTVFEVVPREIAPRAVTLHIVTNSSMRGKARAKASTAKPGLSSRR